ncbi:uncharacterized protein B0I36DRAFT_329103 [Microdochium trichocladiopsis]|uniref:Uncharacterized protein n=1 Tax=Microdochium trichocladiopsis TaxID=1682393 RepID=A0A9P8XZ37_9PEZI|nr:uncharacterized protein B0I36DRAFT_329103 [Microdochium trichocladiopsis]KAH7025773.1 hypothetical protein B0I36DRAFT_329103 [Microdochium trichocladiopsis]
MGLPLFIAPVDSDIPSKLAAKSPISASHARSPIRRDAPGVVRSRRRQIQEAREHRFRLLATLQGEEEALLSAVRSQGIEPSISSTTATSVEDVVSRRRELEHQQRRQNAERGTSSLEPTSRSSPDDPSSRHIEWASSGRTSPRHYSSWGREPWLPELRAGSFGARSYERQDPASSTYYRPGRPEGIYARRAPLSHGTSDERLRLRRLDQPIHARSLTSIRRNRLRPYDGLGDRDRSLSPEGDAVWDTLQSTLTPDPQPPSASSSFASTNASTVASQRTVPLSSANTSMTSPDEPAEPPCDPVADNSELNDSEDETLDQILGQRLAGASRRSATDSNRRSYADVAADLSLGGISTDEGASDWLTGLHRIVRGLVSRDDIPDEWWAEVGLTRSMREDSN